MSSRRATSFQSWCLTGTLAGSLILGSAVLSQADPLRLPGRSSMKPSSQQLLAQQQQAASLVANQAEGDEPITGQESATNIEARLAKAARTVRLNFLEASWKTVLSTFAEQAGVELVADPKMIPRDRFTRRDKSFYTTDDALKILNRELQTFDLKLAVKGEKLALTTLTSSGPKYRRPSIYGSGLVTDHSLPESNIPPAFESRQPPKRIGDIETADGREVPISTESTEVPSGRIQLTAATETRHVDPHAATLMSVQLTHRKTKDVANVLYRAFQKNAELISDGPDGLPAIRVYSPAPRTKQAVGRIALAPPKRTLRFTIAMDHARGRLTIQAAALTARSVAEMIRKLDAPDASRTKVDLFASVHGEKVETMAEMVQKQLNRLSKERAKAPSMDNALAFQGDGAQPANGNANAQPASDDAAAQPQNPAEPPQPGEKQPGISPDLIGGLKGDVSVESVPDLGVMILRGNQKDVDAVMEIIREIEKLSAGAVPDVELLMLRHSNSEALAELLTQVYDRLNNRRRSGPTTQAATSAANQTVTILPVVKPNAILIVAAAADIESVKALAEELDQPIDPQAEFKMFRLKSAIAEQVLTTIQTFYEDRPGLGTRVLAVADARTNAVLVYARPSDLTEVANLIKELDQLDTAAVSQVKFFPLKNAVATETAIVLQQTLQSVLNAPSTQVPGGAQGQQNQGGGGAGAQGSAALRGVKSTVLQFLSDEGPGQRLLQSGILADIRISADGRTNSIVVTAPEASMMLMEELIKQLDRQTTTVAEIKVFGLTNGDARSMVTLLEQLFANAANDQNAQDRLGIQVAGAEDASSGLVPLKFSVDSRTNSIVAVGAAESLRVVEAILIRLDESDVRQRESIVFRLKNSPATDVATAINNFLTSRRDLEQSGDGLVSPFEQIEREVIVVPERISNTLLISATPRYFKEIRELVINLDSAPQQVTIQALLVEVTLDNTDEFGVELGLQDSVLFRRSVVDQLTTLDTTSTAPNGVQTTTQNIISQTAIPGFLFNNQQLGNNTSIAPGIVGKQSLTSFSLGRQNGELGYGGLVLAAGSESVSVLLRALAATRRVDVLSRPQIRTLDNQLGVIQVGQEVPVVNGFTNTGLTVSPTVEIRQAGIILQVVPRISPDGRVVMDVAAERSTYLPEDQGVTIFSDPATGTTIRAPRKDISTARASVAVSNEQTVVLGGMISSTNTNIQRKVPVIGDLPFLGLPFRYNFSQNVKKELLIFLTPRVIKTDADSEYIKQVETARIHFMEQDAEEIHGPIMAAPPPTDPLETSPPVDAPLQDDPSVPTTQVPPEGIIPPPPVEGDGVKLMRRGSKKRTTTPVAMRK